MARWSHVDAPDVSPEQTNIPVRFLERIIRHAYAASVYPTYPLILAIQGSPGDGKSFQTKRALEESGFLVLHVSGSSLSGRYEGDSKKAVQKAYIRARESYSVPGRTYPAILIEDFDLGAASEKEATRYTINSQLLSAYMMNLADDIGLGEVGTDARFPVFITGNDFTDLHRPLARPGRMDFFTWRPTEEELAYMVWGLLRGVGDVSETFCRQMVNRLPLRTIAEYRAAVDIMRAHNLFNSMKLSASLGPREFIEQRRVSRDGLWSELQIGNWLGNWANSNERAHNFLDSSAETNRR